MYNTIQSRSFGDLFSVRYDLVSMTVYDIYLRATTTTDIGIGGVTIHIGLVSSTTDSI